MEAKSISQKQALTVALFAIVVNSFISTFLSMILRTGMDSSVVTFYRLMLVSLVMLPWAFSKKEYRENMRSISPGLWKLFGIYCLTKVGGFVLWAEGLRLGAPAFTMSTLSNMQPIFVVVFVYLIFKEKTSLRSLGGIFVCLLGVTIIGADNVYIGRVCGEYVADVLLTDGGKNGEIEGLAGTSGGIERDQGFREGIAKNPKLEITANNNADWLREKAITVAEEGRKKVATFTYTISFAWGSRFKNMNPSEYYDTDEGKNSYKGNAYLTDLGNFYEAMTGEEYNPDVEPAKAYKEMNFAIIINADTSGTAGA